MEQTPEVKEVTTLALTIPDQARQLVIASNEDYVRAGALLVAIKGIRKKINDTFKPIKQKMDAAKQEVLDQERAADKPLVEAEEIIKPRLAAWNKEQERIRQEEEMRLQEIARKEEEERRLKEAILAEQSGDKEEAEAIINTPIQAPPVVVQKTTPKVAGVSFRENWDFEIINENLIPRQYLMPNMIAIRAVVKGLKNQTNIPGVKVFSTSSVSAGRAA